MSKKPFPRIITGAVVTTIAVAAFLTFTRGEAPQTDTASASVPGVSGTANPFVEGSTTTPTPSPSASADAAERNAETANPKATTPARVTPTRSPTSSPPKNNPTRPTPTPTPSPQPCDLLGAILGGCK